MNNGWQPALSAAAAAVGATCSFLFGGLDVLFWTLVSFMALDYLSGLVVAAVFHRSDKTASGTLSSKVCRQGLIRKGGVLMVVLVAAALDRVMGSTVIRDGAVTAFLAEESISLLENAGLMGVPIPAPLQQAIDLLKGRARGEPAEPEAHKVQGGDSDESKADPSHRDL